MFSLSPSLKRICVAFLAFLALLGRALPSSAASVRIISAEEMDFPEGQQSVQVELRASGYTVTVERTAAVEPGLLLDELEAQSSSEFIASVAVVQLGRGGIAYVWLSESQQMYRVTSSETEVARAANVLSLRVVELISLQGSGSSAERSVQDHETGAGPATKKETEATRKAPHPLKSPWMLWAALGPQFGSGLKSPLASARLGLDRNATDSLAFEVSGHFSLAAASQRFEHGDVGVSEKGLSVSALVQHTGRFRWQLGPSMSMRCVRLKSVPNDGSSVLVQSICGAAVGALFRVGASFDAFSLWLSGVGTFGTQRIDLLADSQVLATLGRPDGWFGLMIGRQF